MLLHKYFAVKYKLCCPDGLLSLSLSSSANVAANGEVMDLEKEETMKNCSLAWPEHSSLRALSFSAYTESNNALCGREVWLVLHSQPLFLQTTCLSTLKVCGPQAKGAGYARLRSGHKRLEEPQLKEVNI